MQGYTVVDAATVLSTHLTELLKSNMADLLSYGEVQKLLKDLPKEQAELLKDLVPTLITTLRHPARSANPARRARLDPRPLHHPGRHRRRRRRIAQPGHAGRTCARAHLAPDLRAIHRP